MLANCVDSSSFKTRTRRNSLLACSVKVGATKLGHLINVFEQRLKQYVNRPKEVGLHTERMVRRVLQGLKGARSPECAVFLAQVQSRGQGSRFISMDYYLRVHSATGRQQECQQLPGILGSMKSIPGQLIPVHLHHNFLKAVPVRPLGIVPSPRPHPTCASRSVSESLQPCS